MSAAEGAGRGRLPPVHPPGVRRVRLPLPPQDRVCQTKKGFFGLSITNLALEKNLIRKVNMLNS